MLLTTLKGIGAKTRELLMSRGIESVKDLLFHLPNRYQDRTRIIPIGNLRPDDQAVIEGEVVSNQIIFGRKRQWQMVLADDSGEITLKFFHFGQSQKQAISVGDRLRCFGEVKIWQRRLMMIHPEYRKVSEQDIIPVEETLTPIYPAIEGIGQNTLRKLIAQAVLLTHSVPELLPAELREQYQFSSLVEALRYLHNPPPDCDQALLSEGLHPMQQRLAFEELLAHQVAQQKYRKRIRQHQAVVCKTNTYRDDFLQHLPFELTGAQQQVEQDIQADLQTGKPMMRLVQGDVGSGKTVVAALAALQVVASGYQVALMAPTELLAEQHYQNFTHWCAPLGLKVAWLAGKLKVAERRAMLAMIENGEANIVVGTHALFQDAVQFKQLAMVIIDEQHRFGVKQRSALRGKGIDDTHYPHQLIMTATPIPRTLAMTLYADLDTSIINELPPGRTPINTVLINNQRRSSVIERIQHLCEQGGQVYWVCPLISESDQLEWQAAEEIAEMLKAQLDSIEVDLVHGKLKSAEKQAIMQRFFAGEIQVLVATTVIEVGINVPNASLMIIENAERMGLSQLHQLRGRVGRGNKESHCVLLYQDPLSETARKRLTVMRESTDGFYIAEQDLKLRGAGELLGTKQTGMQSLKIADIYRDRQLLPVVQQAARTVVSEYPQLAQPLIQRWIGSKEQFAKIG